MEISYEMYECIHECGEPFGDSVFLFGVANVMQWCYIIRTDLDKVWLRKHMVT